MRRMGRRLLVILAASLLHFALVMGVTSAQEEEEPAPCRVSETGRVLDFWIGEWNVTDGDDEFYGNNRIEWDAGGCAIACGTGGSGSAGVSTFAGSVVSSSLPAP